jgi:hypothetical protein
LTRIGEADELACPSGVKRNLVFESQPSVRHEFLELGQNLIHGRNSIKADILTTIHKKH